MPSSPFGTVDELRAAQERLRRFNEWDERYPEPALDAGELRELFEVDEPRR
jgi:hypothetical protein